MIKFFKNIFGRKEELGASATPSTPVKEKYPYTRVKTADPSKYRTEMDSAKDHKRKHPVTEKDALKTLEYNKGVFTIKRVSWNRVEFSFKNIPEKYRGLVGKRFEDEVKEFSSNKNSVVLQINVTWAANGDDIVILDDN